MKFLLLLVFAATMVFPQDLKDVNPLSIINMIESVLQLPRNEHYSTNDDVGFFLYSKDNPKHHEKLTWKNMYIVSPTKPVKIIIHGWLENSNRTWYKTMTHEFLKNGDYSVIQIDWSKPAAVIYAVAAINTKLVGTIISQFVIGLANERNISYSNFHVIGHSLGAHVAGFVGQSVYKSTSSKIGRISGLDPAGPLFESPLVGKYNRLNSEDANIVDIIHTDGGIFGFIAPVGTIDFYPNGGFGVQPGCFIKADIHSVGDFLETIFCSHTRSYKIFSEAINNNTIKAIECKSYYLYLIGACNLNRKIDVGVKNINRQLNGTYYFNTNNKSPYLK